MAVAGTDEMLVNSYIDGSQTESRITVLSNGGWLLTWMSDGQDGSGIGIYQRAFSPDGQPVGTETRVNTATEDKQTMPQIAVLEGGGWVTVWQSYGQDGAGYGIYQQAFDATGSATRPETRVNTYMTGHQIEPRIIPLSEGGWVVAWISYGQDGSGAGVYQQIFGADGEPVGSEARVNVHTPNNQFEPRATPLSDGKWVVIWHSEGQNQAGWEIYQRVFGVDGSALTSEIRVNVAIAGNQANAQVAPLSDGGWVVVWQSPGIAGLDIFQRVFNTDGTARTPEVRVSSHDAGDQAFAQITTLQGGGWVVTWQSDGQDGPLSFGIYQQVFDSQGDAVGEEQQVNTDALPNQISPKITALSSGGWVVTWTSLDQDGDLSGVYQRAFRADGEPAGDEVRVNVHIPDSQYAPQIKALPNGAWVVAWESNGQDGSAEGIYQRVFWINDAPTAKSIPQQAATEDEPFSFTLAADTFSDANAFDSFTRSAALSDGAPLPAWLHFDPTTGKFSGTPGNDAVGTLLIRVTAADQSGATGSTILTLDVQNVNDTPQTAATIPSRTATEDNVFAYTVPSGTFIDPDKSDVLIYSATLENGSALPGWLTFNAVTRTFSGTPGNDAVGTIGIRMTATDTSGQAAQTTFNLTVSNVNDAPQLAAAIPSRTATEDKVFTYTVPATTFTDPDKSDVLTYSAKLANGSALPGWLTFNATTRTFSGTPDNDAVGTLSIRMTATDTGGQTAQTTFNLAISNVNDAPQVAAAIPNRTATEDKVFTYTVPATTFTDPDKSDVLTYSAKLANGSALPGWLTFNAITRTFSGTPDNGAIGPLSIRVTATDVSGRAAQTTFNLTIANVNDAPQVAATIPNRTATEDKAFVYSVPTATFIDPDKSDVLTYSATLANGSALPGWLKFNATTRTFSGTPDNDAAGALAIRLVATDLSGRTAQTTFTLTVANVNDRPTLPATTAVATLENAPLAIDVLSRAHDDDGDLLEVTAASVRSGFGRVSITKDGRLLYDPTLAANQNIGAGETKAVIVRYTVSDGKGGTATGDIILTVKGISPDIFKGGAGNDTLRGSKDGDILYGYAGHDTLDGGTGADRLYGAAGNDTYIIDNLKDVTIENANEGIDLIKASVSWTLAANTENLTLTGTVRVNATGNTLANKLIGNTGNNVLDGRAGDDTLTGGRGADSLYGGTGKDVFVFLTAAGSTVATSGRDTIFDFTKGDRIDLRAINANLKVDADQIFTFIGTEKFHKKAGELRYDKALSDTYIYGDTNGDGLADFAIHLDDPVALAAGDFLL